ncbi:alpha/beta hydrolase [Bacillaceae bacterium IKA-2]|nr:alpha/beta hydrolase [Bacillaceae bacterium IKA-2]
MGSSSGLLNKVRKIFPWLKGRINKTATNDAKLKTMILTLWLMTLIAASIASLAMPTGFGVYVDLFMFLFLNTVLFFLTTALIGYLLTLLYVPLPRLFVGSIVYTTILTYYILVEANSGVLFSWIFTAVYLLVGLCLGIIVTIYQSNRITPIRKVFASMIPAILILFAFIWTPSIANDHVERSFTENDYIAPLTIENPAELGTYSIRNFTYANGLDKHRREFSNHADVLSDSVDGSEYIKEWHRFRKFFWGFDEKKLPVNGRVWMPQGEEKFPLVLMVHGNHRMENFSDAGYEYLGELLASRGYIAVSVDQNFLNYSNWTGIPKNDMKLRTWVLIQHLLQIDQFKGMPESPFYQKVDMDRVAVIGHSRGGQAAAMVADYQKWFDSDLSLAGMENINVQAVIGIAPTERKADGMWPELNNVSYLTLHGARDGDVHNYHGDRQFSRTSIEADSDKFKAGVYIAEANHSQFNQDWGKMDQKLPGGLFLNKNQIMDPDKQREVAKVYISAFIESTLGGNEQYIPLFRDVRHGSEWLPNTQYVTRFENSEFHPIVNFNKTNSKTKFPKGITAEAIGFDIWEIESAVNRSGNKKAKQGMVFEWENTGTYTLSIPEDYRMEYLNGSFESFYISMANLDDENTTDPKLTVTFEMSNGKTANVPLERYKEIAPSIHTQYTRNRYLEDIFRKGKYSVATEPVFQTYEIPMEYFKKLNRDLKLQEIERITISFKNGPGKLMVDDIGFVGYE